jgi:SAM-dependent methyltransferase
VAVTTLRPDRSAGLANRSDVVALLRGVDGSMSTRLAQHAPHMTPEAMDSSHRPCRGLILAAVVSAILNLGCGTKTSPRTTNIDWSIHARLRRNPLGRRLVPLVLNEERRRLFLDMDDVLVHDLRKGIPAPRGSADAVYHSHVLEHIDRDAVPGYLAEIRRVLKVGGVHRVVVPDLERYARDYLASLEHGLHDKKASAVHDATVSQMILQMVRREAAGTSQQAPFQRRLENLLLGDARKRGETHMWMWDRVSLTEALSQAGFQEIEVVDWRTSRIPDWNELGLDRGPDGGEYKPESLYVEALR